MNIELPRGFRYAGVACGIKQDPTKRDLSMIICDHDAVAAGTYTRNQIVAAPVILCRQRTPGTRIRGVVINSGNANACTGKRGEADAQRMAEAVALQLDRKVTAEQILVMSTGVIGQFLPIDKIERGIEQAARQLGTGWDRFQAAAEGMLTTDKGIKVGGRQFDCSLGKVTIAAMAKGAGMIGPNMATMLCCITTDARLRSEQAQDLLQAAVDNSFNCISVEGHTSTNDSVILLASGMATEQVLEGQAEQQFAEQLEQLCIELAKQIPADGEGATHLIEVTVRGAANDQEARAIARTVGSSNLVKTAVYGHDPNWGRIVSAAGYAPASIKPSRLMLRVNGETLYRNGEPLEFDERFVSRSMKENFTTRIELEVGDGPGTGTHWTSDLTVEYVRFNSEYTT